MQQTNKHKRNVKTGTTGWERWFTGNCARNENFTILANGLSLKIKQVKFFEILDTNGSFNLK